MGALLIQWSEKYHHHAYFVLAFCSVISYILVIGTRDRGNTQMAYSQTFKSLHWTSLDKEQHAKTCGYWYVVTSYGCTPHTAFRTREAFLSWAARRDLLLNGDVPQAGEWATGRIEGEYRRSSHMSYDEFFALEGERVHLLDNGEVTTGIITRDDDGLRTVHHLNCNKRDRPLFPHTTQSD